VAVAPVETDTVQTVLVAPSMAGAERRPSIAKVTVHHVEAATEVMVSVLTAPAALSTVGAEPPQPIAVQPLPLDQLLHNLVPFQLPPRVAGRVEAATEAMVSVLMAPAALSTVGAEQPRPIAVQPLPLDLLPHLQLPPVQQEAVRPQSTPLLDLSPLRTFKLVSIATILFKVVISAPASPSLIKLTLPREDIVCIANLLWWHIPFGSRAGSSTARS
jgi:hypothetical protein